MDEFLKELSALLVKHEATIDADHDQSTMDDISYLFIRIGNEYRQFTHLDDDGTLYPWPIPEN